MIEIVNFRIIFKLISINLFIIAVALLGCIGIAILYSEPIWPFLLAGIISAVIGFVLFRFNRGEDENAYITKKDAYLIVSLSWLFISIIGALPFLFSGSIPGVTDALFESVSGFTTTGSSILTDIEALPKSVLFWRSLTHWIGGLGIIVLVIIIMPTLQIGGYNLFTLESSLQEKIQPKIKSVGFRLLWIYLSLTLAETALLMLGKMNFFESICHAFGTVATGGFSPKNTSISDYSPYIQYVIMIFMVLAGTNFVIHYFIFKGNFKKVKENEEVRFYLAIIFILGLIITLSLHFDAGKPLELSFRESYFQVISIVTCTGYATTDYLLWPQYAWIIIFFSMFLGGSTGSTAGGIKMVRHLVMIKNIKRIFQQLVSPRAIIPIRLNGHPISGETNNSILSFISLYMLIFIIGTMLLALMGIDGKTASSSVATCMAGIGPGIGNVGPVSNFAHLPQLAKLLLSFLMLVGRLEIYTIILLFTRFFWSK
ncbi:MAG: TrkH family potassium uptake protein [Bacteroidales bacterium]|nr:TrkH family potassium uptake protein [Bacteroidales bacterium]